MKKQIHHNLAKTPLIIRVVSLYIFSAALTMAFNAWQEQNNTPVASVAVVQAVEEKPVSVEPSDLGSRPRRIELPRIGLMREVIDGEYNYATQEWTLSEDKAQYATMTDLISESTGQTLIYGHNTAAVLEPVRQVRRGDELVVTTERGDRLVYVYVRDKVVASAETAVLYESSKRPRVVVMTCEGWFSETRRLLYFDYKEAL